MEPQPGDTTSSSAPVSTERAPGAPLAPPGKNALAEIDADFVRRFRGEIHVLGAAWMCLGLATASGILLAYWGDFPPFDRESMTPQAALLIVATLVALGAAWLILGALTCKKQLGGVYAALGLTYLALAGNLLQFNTCGAVILALIILQAHRVLASARQLRRAGAPLTVRPKHVAQAGAQETRSRRESPTLRR